MHVRLPYFATIAPIQVSRDHRMVVILRQCKPRRTGSRTSPRGWPRLDPAALSTEPATPESGDCPLGFGLFRRCARKPGGEETKLASALNG
jgi:hypothetical protein